MSGLDVDYIPHYWEPTHIQFPITPNFFLNTLVEHLPEQKKPPKVELMLWDCGTGGEDYDRLRPLQYYCTDLFVLTLSPTPILENAEQERDWDQLERTWAREISQHNPDNAPILIVWTDGWRVSDTLTMKSDSESLSEDGEFRVAKRREALGRTPEQFQERVRIMGANCVGLVEVNCATGEGLDTLLGRMVVEGLKYRSRVLAQKKENECQIL